MFVGMGVWGHVYLDCCTQIGLGMDCGNRAGMLTARRVRPGAGVGGTVAAIFPSSAILSAALSLSALVAGAMLQSDRIIRLANCFYLVLLKLVPWYDSACLINAS